MKTKAPSQANMQVQSQQFAAQLAHMMQLMGMPIAIPREYNFSCLFYSI
jgi:hypothetical protein